MRKDVCPRRQRSSVHGRKGMVIVSMVVMAVVIVAVVIVVVRGLI